MEREESLSNRKRQGLPQDIGGKRARLDGRNERDRARRKETDRQKEVRLAKRRDRQSKKSSFCYRDAIRDNFKIEAQEY